MIPWMPVGAPKLPVCTQSACTIRILMYQKPKCVNSVTGIYTASQNWWRRKCSHIYMGRTADLRARRPALYRKKKRHPIGCLLYVGATYFPGASARQVSWAEASLTDLSRDGCPSRFSSTNQTQVKRKDTLLGAFSVLTLPIFPGASARQISWAEANLTDLSRDGRPSRFSSTNQTQVKRKDTLLGAFSVLALPIFPGRLQPSIVGRSELNFRVRDGNGWTLALISTNY